MSNTGRRSAARRRGPSPTALIAVLLVLLTAGALSLVREHVAPAVDVPPQETPLRVASLGCPSELSGGGTLHVAANGSGAEGDVRLVTGGDERTVRVRPSRTTDLGDVDGPAVAAAEGDLAPELLAARVGGRSLAATPCVAPSPTAWFTGLGAGARHDSVLELVNPDEGLAVADVVVRGPSGVVDVPDLRGVSVRGHESARFDLGEVMPRRGELALQVVVSRGRLAASVLDQVPAIGSEAPTEDWLTAQDEPGRRTVLLGIAPGPGEHELVVSNPGEDEARVTVRILTPDSSFTPSGLRELRVPAGSVRARDVSAVVRQSVRDGAIGFEVTSSHPVTASTRAVTDGDLSRSVAVLPSDSRMTALVPSGRSASVLLADASRVGVVVVNAWSARGEELEAQRVEVRPGQGGVVDLPSSATLVQVAPERTGIHAAAIVTGDGATVVPFREPVVSALVPDVRPGLG